MLRHGQTILVVTLVSVIIWLFAEGENVQRVTLEATLQVVPSASGNVIAWVESDTPWDGHITLSVSGSTAGIDELRDRLRQPILISPGIDGFSATPGNQTLDIRSLVRAAAAVRETGVAIEETEPRTIVAHADVLEPVELPIRVEIADAEIDGVPEANPPRAIMQVPSLAKERLTTETVLFARLGPDIIRGLTRGRRETIQAVPIEAPPELTGVRGLRIAPLSTRVSFTLREKTATEVIPSVPVHLRIAPVQFNKWVVSIPESDQFLRDVTVTGPSQEIARIRSGDLRIIAMVTLSAQDLASGITSKQVTFSDLPLTLQFQVEDPIVNLEIRPLVDPASTPAPGGSGPAAGPGLSAGDRDDPEEPLHPADPGDPGETVDTLPARFREGA